MSDPISISFTVDNGKIQIDSVLLTPYLGLNVRVFSIHPFDAYPLGTISRHDFVDVSIPASLPAGPITVRDFGLDPGVYEVLIEVLS